MKHLNQIFKRLNLTKENGLYITSEEEDYKMFSNRVNRLIKNVIKPDAFFCIDNKPFILFFENIEQKEIKLKEVWNFNESPVIIIAEKEAVEIYNGFNYLSDNDTLQKFGSSEKLDDFTYFKLVSGETWEEYQQHFSYKKRVDYHLLENINATREHLISEKIGLEKELANSLLGKIIFVRYLIDRNVGLDFGQKGKIRNWTNKEFCQLLSDKNKTSLFFQYLNDKFNGDLFPIDEKDFDSIPDQCFTLLIKLLSGEKIPTGQTSLFDLYNFSIIPVEFISNVYESFIGQDEQEKKGAYYTPLFLVDYILSETVEKKLQSNSNNFSCKVLDPACGSGIFLVETLRKIIEKYQKSNPDYHDNPSSFKLKLKQLAEENIYGIDKDQSAVNVAIFSIYLTLLDYQEPSEIATFKFPHLLGTNFFANDFFDTKGTFNEHIKDYNFDFILGNPPWKRGKGEKKDPLYIQYINERKLSESNNSIDIEISNKEIAQAFVLRVSDFSSTNTQVALIVTSKMLYNLNAHGFRRYWLDRFYVNKVFELAPVRREVFDKSSDSAISPACIVFYRFANGNNTDENIIDHITLKPSRFFSLFKILTIQKTDSKEVTQKQLKKFDFLWKVLIYGSYLDFNFIKRLKSNYKSITDVVSHGKNYIVKQGMKRKDGDKKIDVSELVGFEFIDLKQKTINQFQIAQNLKKWELDTVGYVYREDGKVAKEMFEPPVLLVKETVKTNLESISAISRKKVVFTDKVTAIKSRNNSDDDNYYNIAALLNSKLFSYYICHVGSTTGVMIEQQIHDMEKFGFPFVNNHNFKSNIQEIENSVSDDFFELNAATSQLKEHLDDLVLDSFDLIEVENDVLDFSLNFVIPEMMKLSGYKNLYNPITFKDSFLQEYIQLFLSRFNEVYEEMGQHLVVEVKYNKHVIGLFFELCNIDSNKDLVTWVESNDSQTLQKLLSLGSKQVTNQLFVQKDVRGFEENGFYIVKPNEKKLWHKAIGHLDVNEFVDAVLAIGKKRIVDVQ